MNLNYLPNLFGPTVSNVEQAHTKIHEGWHFTINDVTTGVNIAAPKRYHLLAPSILSEAQVHFIFMVQADKGILVQLFESPTVTVNGTAMTPINNDRNSPNTSVLDLYEDPIVTVDGTLIYEKISGTTTIGGEVGSESDHSREFLLKSNTRYQLKITVLADTTALSTHFNWYEFIKTQHGQF